MPQQVFPLLEFLTLSWWDRDFSQTLGVRPPLSPPGPLVFFAFLSCLIHGKEQYSVLWWQLEGTEQGAAVPCPLSLGFWLWAVYAVSFLLLSLFGFVVVLVFLFVCFLWYDLSTCWHCRPAWPQSHRDLPTSSSLVLGSKAFTTMLSISVTFCDPIFSSKKSFSGVHWVSDVSSGSNILTHCSLGDTIFSQKGQVHLKQAEKSTMRKHSTLLLFIFRLSQGQRPSHSTSSVS